MNAAPPLTPFRYDHDVTSWHPLVGDFPKLAADVVDILGVPKRMLAADFRKMVEDRDRPFPRGMNRNTRGMRLTRLLEYPVRVGDVLLRMETREKRHIYDKTQTLVTERAELPPAPPFLHAPSASRSRSGAESTTTLPNSVVERLDRLDQRLAVIEGLLRAGGASPVSNFGTSSPAPDASAPSPAAVPGAPPATPPGDPAPPLVPVHFTYIGKSIPRPLNVCRVEELERNLGALLAGLDLPEIPRGPMSDVPSDDCARRLARVMRELGEVTRTLAPRVEPYAPTDTDLGPVAAWQDLSGRVTRAGHVLDKIARAHPDLRFARWVHPDLRGITPECAS